MIAKDSRLQRDQFFNASPQLHKHETGLGIKGIPSHVVITEELDVVETAHADRVLGPFVDVYVFTYAGVTSSSLTSATDCCKGFVINDCSLPSLSVVEDDDWKPDSIHLLYGDHIHCLVQFYVVKVQPCINPSHSQTEFQLQYLLDLLYLLHHHDVHTCEKELKEEGKPLNL